MSKTGDTKMTKIGTATFSAVSRIRIQRVALKELRDNVKAIELSDAAALAYRSSAAMLLDTAQHLMMMAEVREEGV